jgi:anti-sigma factor RsiW
MSMDCRRIESLLPLYVDGEAATRDVAEVERHLVTCADCRAAVAAQRTTRAVLQARGRYLAPPLPPGLRIRIAAALNPRPVVSRSLGWRARVSAFAAAAAMLTIAVTIFEFVSPRSNVLYAAQLAIDHVRCFVAERSSTAAIDAPAMERVYAAEYGWKISVPPGNDALGLRLIAARRCPFWLGQHAHALYRVGDKEVSLFIDRGEHRMTDQLQVLGHREHIWQSGGSSYALIARGLPEAELAEITAYLQARTQAH